MEVDEIKAEDNFKFDLGMSSFDVVCMTEDIKNTFGIALKATDFIKFKTIGLMAEHIDNA